jgi:ribosomal protein L18E
MSEALRQAIAAHIDQKTEENRIASLTDPIGVKAATVRLSLREWDEVCRALKERKMNEQHVTIDYVNWRGARGKRTIIPGSIRFGATEWHPEPQWLLSAWDLSKCAALEFALKDVHSWAPIGVNLRAEPLDQPEADDKAGAR